MKNKFLLIATLFLFISFDSFFAIAQDSPYIVRWEERKIFDDQSEIMRNIFDEPSTFMNTTHHPSFSADEVTTLNAIIPDFQVNENAGSDGIQQSFPSIDRIWNFVITWLDEHDGGDNIYAQRYSNNGTALGTNFKVNDDPGSTDKSYPSISVDWSGNFVIAWSDNRLGDSNIYAQRYSSDGTALGINFKVNDDQGSAIQRNPSISSDWSGNFVITWSDKRLGDFNIYAQRYSSDGTALGTNFKVNDDQGSLRQLYPSISTDGRGYFVITWLDCRHIFFDIYAQRYSSYGTALGANFKVNDDQGSALQWYPSVSSDWKGNFVITWEDYRNDDADIYARRYSSDGTALGSNFKVNDDQGSVRQEHPSISTDLNGNFLITWQDERDSDLDIYAQRYSRYGTALGSNFKVNDDTKSAVQDHPVISLDGSGNSVIAWSDYRFAVSDIFAQRYSSDGTALGTNYKVNDNEARASQDYPAISADGSGNFVITWWDRRYGDYDIFAQRYSCDGTALGTNFKVNDDQGNEWQHDPAISVDDSGNFVITWRDRRSGDQGIYAQRYLSDGTALGTNFKVNDDPGYSIQFYPSISSDGSGNFVIAWTDHRSGDDYIYAQRYSSDGTALGTNFKVSDDPGDMSSISTDGSGNFVITWRNEKGWFNWDIYAQRYSSDGTALGTNFKVNDDQGTRFQQWPSISSDRKGNFVITWEDYRHGDANIYAQRYSSDGTALGTNFKVNDDTGSAPQWSASISTDVDGHFVITWEDRRHDYAYIYAQRYSSDGTALDSNFRLTNTMIEEQFSPDVVLCHNRIYTTWVDNRIDWTRPDIWANVLDWENPVGINDDRPYQIPSEYHLYQNYPNPFNTSTTISYSIPDTRLVQLMIYNTLGQLVRKLVNENQSPGNHFVVWDGRNEKGDLVTSGIYFYTLKIGKKISISKRMLLLK